MKHLVKHFKRRERTGTEPPKRRADRDTGRGSRGRKVSPVDVLGVGVGGFRVGHTGEVSVPNIRQIEKGVIENPEKRKKGYITYPLTE